MLENCYIIFLVVSLILFFVFTYCIQKLFSIDERGQSRCLIKIKLTSIKKERDAKRIVSMILIQLFVLRKIFNTFSSV